MRIERWCLGLVVLISMLANAQSPARLPTKVREADARCAGCHADIFRKYLLTPMAAASGPANSLLRPGSFINGIEHTEYRIEVRGNTALLNYQSTVAPEQTGTFHLRYFLGSGHLGTTYLYSIGNYLFESPVAWYANSQRYAMKPGLEELKQMAPPLPMQTECMRCHMSAVQPSDAGTLNRFNELPFRHYGITCEQCHGDSDTHVTSRGKAAIVNPERLDAEQRDSVCISCHLEGDVSVARAGHSAINYRPGESISTYLAFFVRTGADLTDRGVSEVEQLAQSQCKRASGNRMSCTSCHDPHFRPDRSHRAAFYRARCLACHSDPKFAETHHPDNPDCAGCHMPTAEASNILHVAWTDHRILRVPQGRENRTPHSESGGRLAPIFSPGVTTRDQAMADYQALLEGDPSLKATVWTEFSALRDQLSNDKDALNAFGNLNAERGDARNAEQAFRRVLELEPLNLTAASNLAILLARQGKMSESIALLRPAFERNEDIPGLAANLARVECMAGDAQAAQTTLARALIYAPTSEELQTVRRQLAGCAAGAIK